MTNTFGDFAKYVTGGADAAKVQAEEYGKLIEAMNQNYINVPSTSGPATGGFAVPANIVYRVSSVSGSNWFSPNSKELDDILLKICKILKRMDEWAK